MRGLSGTWYWRLVAQLLFRIAGLERDAHLHGNQFNIVLAGTPRTGLLSC